MLGSTIAKSNPQLVEDLQRMPEKGLRLVSQNLPKFANAARETGRSVKASVSGLASTAGDNLQQVLPDRVSFKNAGAAVASAAALQAAERGIVRFATRRPLLVLLGGLAIVGGIALARRQRKHAGTEPSGDEMGEGSYEGARDYHKRTAQFLKSEGKQVAARARQAKKALEGEEGAELEAAEAEGRSRARS